MSKIYCNRLTASVPQGFPSLPSSIAFAYNFAASLPKEVKSISPPLKSRVTLGLALVNRKKQK